MMIIIMSELPSNDWAVQRVLYDATPNMAAMAHLVVV